MPETSRERFSRRIENERQPHFVYQLWDDRGQCVYVGMSRKPGDRIATHMQQPWWHAVATMSAERYPDKASARVAEADLIQRLDPSLNWMHADKAVGSRSGGGHGHVAFRKSDVVEVP